MDIVAFGGQYTFVALGMEDGTLSEVTQASENFAHDAGGWRLERHVRVMGDVNGDGRDDVVGFGNRGTFVARGGTEGRFGNVTMVLDEFG